MGLEYTDFVKVGLEYTDFAFTPRPIEILRRVDSFNIFDITSMLTDTQLKLAETLVYCFLVLFGSKSILRNILRYFRCYHFIHCIIRGCEIVFVSINRHIYLLPLN